MTAEEYILDYTGSSKWEQVENINWTTAEMMDIMQAWAGKNGISPHVVKSLPTDECVEQWWAEGQDQENGFWQEAPFRTNGDVVEEIKTALKYFIETWQSLLNEKI